MTLKELVMDTVAKTPHFSIAGEIADLLYSRVKQVSGDDTAYMAADMYLAEINKKFHTNYTMKK